MKFFKKKPTDTTPPHTPAIGTAGSLREFVYLDEVSVYSLTSSPDMPPPVTMSEVADSTAGEVVSAQIEGGASLVAKANLSGQLSSSRSNGLQVQRQFNIQSQFARLHGMYRPTFLLTASAPDETKLKEATSLRSALNQLEDTQRAIPAKNLTRGALAEIRVSLSAHHTFDIATFVRLMTDWATKYPDLLQLGDLSEMQSAMSAGDFLSDLMEDLVPIEGHSTTHEIVTEADGKVWVVDIAALNSIWDGEVSTEPLRVVGVTESSSFWKDTRRILHAEAEFDVLGRISRTGLQDEWTPVKMIDTFRRVVPSAANGLIAAVDELKTITDETSPAVEPAQVLVVAGTKLNLQLAIHHSVQATDLSLETLAALIDDGTLEGNLATLNNVAKEFYANHGELERNEDIVGFYRQEAWRNAQVPVSLPTHRSPAALNEPEAPVLELEFIAMYW